MTIALRVAGAWAAGSTAPAPTIGAGTLDGDMMLLYIGCKPFDATINTPAGWTLVTGTNGANGSTANGTDVGSVLWACFYKKFTAGTPAPTISITTGNVSLAVIHTYSKTAGEWETPAGAKGSDTSSGTGFSLTMDADPGVTVGDMLATFATIAGNNATFDTPTLTAASATIGTVTEQPTTEGTTATGLDLESSASQALCTAGTATGAPVVGWTLSVSQTGGGAIVRLREYSWPAEVGTYPSVRSGGGIAPNLPLGLRSNIGRPGPSRPGITRLRPPGQLGASGETAGDDVTVGLTGVSATSGVGSFSVQASVALTGVEGTASVGTAAPGASVALTGVGSTSGIGSVAPAPSNALAGVTATGEAGAIGPPQASVALTGLGGAGQVGSVTAGSDVTQALTGVSATGAVGTPVPSSSVALTGVGSTGQIGTVTPTTGVTVALTGVQATGSAGTLAGQTDAALVGTSASGQLGGVGASGADVGGGTGVAPNLPLGLRGNIGRPGPGRPGITRLWARERTLGLGTHIPAPDVTLALTGVEASSSLGALAPSSDSELIGLSGTGNLGTITPTSGVTVALTGVEATAEVGLLGIPASYEVASFGSRRNRPGRGPYSVGRYYVPASGSHTGDVTVALSGVTSSATAGTLGVSHDEALSGAVATGAVGSLSQVPVISLSGIAAAGSLGTFSSSRTRVLTGLSGSGAVGTLAQNPASGLSGVEGTASVGTLAEQSTLALTGTAGTGQLGTVSAGNDVAVALTGVGSVGAAGTLAPQVARSLTGTAATAAGGMLAQQPSSGLVGVEATGATGLVLPGEPTFALTGVIASGAIGTLAPETSVALSAPAASGQVGTVAPSTIFDLVLVGVQATTETGTLATEAEAGLLTGVVATGQVGDLGLTQGPGAVSAGRSARKGTGSKRPPQTQTSKRIKP